MWSRNTRVVFLHPALLKAFRLSNAQKLLRAAEKYRKRSNWSFKNTKSGRREKIN